MVLLYKLSTVIYKVAWGTVDKCFSSLLKNKEA